VAGAGVTGGAALGGALASQPTSTAHVNPVPKRSDTESIDGRFIPNPDPATRIKSKNE
jgi:hypothetical protein